MSVPLVIWLPDDLNSPWHWGQGDRQGIAATAEDKAGLGELQTLPIQIVISGQAIVKQTLNLPPMKESDKLIAAGFAVENNIAAPLASQHLVLGPDAKSIFVMSQNKMKNIVSALSQAGIAPNGVYADFDVAPDDRPLLLPDRAIYPVAGYTVDRNWADSDQADDTLSQVLTSLNFENAVNLLSGDYAPQSKLPVSMGSLSRMAALLAVAFTAWLGLQWNQTRAMTLQTAALKAETTRLYTAATGQAAPANPALAVTRAVKTGGGPKAGFLDLSAILFRALEQSDGVLIETLQFDLKNNQLSLRLVYPQFESATSLEGLIKGTGGEFRSGGVREQSGRLIGDATLKAAP